MRRSLKPIAGYLGSGTHYYQYFTSIMSIPVGMQSSKVACNTIARFLRSKAARGMPASLANCAGSVTKSPAARVPQVVIPELEITGLPVVDSQCLVTSKYSSGGGT